MAGFGIVAISPFAAFAQSTSLLTNGNFETGNFNGWTVANVRDVSDVKATRNFYIDAPGTPTPPVSNSAGNSYFFDTAPNTQPGGGGNYYAVTTSDAPGQSALIQAFTTPTITAGQGLRLTLTFDWFVNDQSGFNTVKDSSDSLSYNLSDGNGGTRLNQYARVDILRFSSADFSTSAADVLQYIDIDSEVQVNAADPDAPPVNAYQRKTVQLTGLQGGTQYKIRFAEVDNNLALNFGVDNVVLQADITPEPATAALVLPFLGLMPIFLVRSGRKAKKG